MIRFHPSSRFMPHFGISFLDDATCDAARSASVRQNGNMVIVKPALRMHFP